MSWNTVPAEVQTAAVDALTPKQLEAWKLELAGLSMRSLARHLGLARQTASDRIEAAHKNLRASGVTQDSEGRWHINHHTEAA